MNNLYIDGGEVITQFLNQSLIDQMTIATVSVVLGGGYRLFGELVHPVLFKHVRCEGFNETIFQNDYIRGD